MHTTHNKVSLLVHNRGRTDSEKFNTSSVCAKAKAYGHCPIAKIEHQERDLHILLMFVDFHTTFAALITSASLEVVDSDSLPPSKFSKQVIH